MTISPGLTSIRRCLAVGVSNAPAVGHHRHRRQIRRGAFECVGERARHRVADHLHRQHLLPLDRGHHLVGVESTRCRGEHDRLPGGERGHHAPLCGAVHQRWQGEDLGARVLLDALGDLVIGLDELAGGHVPAAERRHEDVVLAPQHTLGHARRAAGVENVEIVGGRLDRRRLGRTRFDDRVVVDGPVHEVVTRVIGDLDEDA